MLQRVRLLLRLTICHQQMDFLAYFFFMVLYMPLLPILRLMIFLASVHPQYEVLRARLFIFLFNCMGQKLPLFLKGYLSFLFHLWATRVGALRRSYKYCKIQSLRAGLLNLKVLTTLSHSLETTYWEEVSTSKSVHTVVLTRAVSSQCGAK